MRSRWSSFTISSESTSTSSEYTISDVTWKCTHDGSSTYTISNRIGKVNMLPAMSEYNIGGMDTVVGLTFDGTLTYDLMSTVSVTVNEKVANLFTYR